MTDLSPHDRRREAGELGRDPAVTERAIQLSQDLVARGAAPVLTLGELALRTGAPAKYLREIVGRRSDPYNDITRPKRDGSTRPISSPEPVLMDVHRWVLANVLVVAPVHQCSWAYQAGRSIVGCAKEHLGARWLIKADIHDFFGSISESRVFDVFNALGYPRLLSFELSRLCTRTHVPSPQGRRNSGRPYLRMPRGVLPQGSPTSGALANAIMHPIDAELLILARRHQLTYTRYSDDLIFSSTGAFSRGRAAGVMEMVNQTLRGHNLELHRRKSRIATPGSREVVLGLMLHGDHVLLPARFKDRVRTHLRGVAKFGLVEHAQHRGFRSVLSMIEHVDGCIAFAKDVDHDFAAAAKTEWDETLARQGYPASGLASVVSPK